MPLNTGNSNKAVSSNIKKLKGEKFPHKQAIAIALDKARKTESRVGAVSKGKVSSMGKQTLEEVNVMQGAGKGTDGRSFDNAWVLNNKNRSWLAGKGELVKRNKSKKGQLQDMNLYDLAKMCAEPLGGHVDPREMDKKAYSKEQRKSMYSEEVYGQGSLGGEAEPSVDEDKEKIAKRKKRLHGKLHPHKKKGGGT